ncbi:MAG: hypothetical protein HY363_03120 [Candidatus Aenigmarchaeota archaeon]|nr:hypothetical protein [Candidatus Aenigmarchaeota archaeon]
MGRKAKRSAHYYELNINELNMKKENKIAIAHIIHEKKIVHRHKQRALDDLTRREFLTLLKGTALGLGAYTLFGNKLFAGENGLNGEDGLDLPITPPPRRGADELYSASDEQEDVHEPETRPTFYNIALPAQESIFYVMDRSLSMDTNIGPGIDPEGMLIRRGTRFAQGIHEIKTSISSLPEGFLFNILIYNCETLPWKEHLVEANEQNKREAYNWLGSRQVHPAGLTGTGPAISYALQENNRDIILLTDGAPNCGVEPGTDIEMIERHREMIRCNNRRNTRIHVFGIRTYGDFRDFCRYVASDSGGSYYDV